MPMIKPRLVLTSDAVGGVWTYAGDLAGDLARAGWDVHLLVLGPAPALEAQHRLALGADIRVSTVDLPLDWMAEDAEQLALASRTLFSICRGLDPDIVHLNSPGLALVAPNDVPLVIGMHSCVASWWNAVRGGPLPDDLAWRTDAVRQALRRADAVIAPSAAFAAEVQRLYGAGLPLQTVPNGRAGYAAPAAENRHGIFSCGRLWDEAKNMAVLDAAAAGLDRPVRVAGDTRSPQPGGGAASFSHLEPMGALSPEAVRRQLAESRIFVSPALYEPFGLGVLEAAQAGCALVLSDIPTFRELWSGAAVFFDPTDPAALADAIRRVDGDDDLCRRLGTAARSRAAHFTADAMAEATAGLYRALAERPAMRELTA